MVGRTYMLGNFHSYAPEVFGLGPTLNVGVLSAGFVFLYLRERSIWPCIIVRGINNVIGFRNRTFVDVMPLLPEERKGFQKS